MSVTGTMTHASVWAQARPLAGRCPSCFAKVQSQVGIVQTYNLVTHGALFPMPNTALRRLEAHLTAMETILKSTILPSNSYYKNLRWLMDSFKCNVGYSLAA